jgi:hypothetical protein
MRDTPPPVPTLAELTRSGSGGNWVWLHCFGKGCGRKFPVALVPLVIRWGDRATIHDLNRNARCARCGSRAGDARTPSWADATIGWQPFPIEGSISS